VSEGDLIAGRPKWRRHTIPAIGIKKPIATAKYIATLEYQGCGTWAILAAAAWDLETLINCTCSKTGRNRDLS
jgi:hypothetical protein